MERAVGPCDNWGRGPWALPKAGMNPGPWPSGSGQQGSGHDIRFCCKTPTSREETGRNPLGINVPFSGIWPISAEPTFNNSSRGSSRWVNRRQLHHRRAMATGAGLRDRTTPPGISWTTGVRSRHSLCPAWQSASLCSSHRGIFTVLSKVALGSGRTAFSSCEVGNRRNDEA